MDFKEWLLEEYGLEDAATHYQNYLSSGNEAELEKAMPFIYDAAEKYALRSGLPDPDLLQSDAAWKIFQAMKNRHIVPQTFAQYVKTSFINAGRDVIRGTTRRRDQLYRLQHNTVSPVKRGRTGATMFDPSAYEEPEVEPEITNQDIDKLIDHLPDNLKQIAEMRFKHHMKLHQIAQSLNVSLSLVKRHIPIITQLLRTYNQNGMNDIPRATGGRPVDTQAIDILPPDLKPIAEMYYKQKMQYIQIAQALGISLSSVKRRFLKIKQLLNAPPEDVTPQPTIPEDIPKTTGGAGMAARK